VRTSDGKWKQKSETLYDLKGKKAAQAELNKRIQDATPMRLEGSELTLRGFVDAYWKPSLDRKCLKLSTRQTYDSALECHIMPALGDYRISDVAPLHVEKLAQAKSKSGLSGKTVRNLLLVLQGIFSLAVDNDMVLKSPVRKSHKPVYRRKEKTVWSAEAVLAIIQAAPAAYRAFFCCAGLTGQGLANCLVCSGST
jgi:hypothetical protein